METVDLAQIKRTSVSNVVFLSLRNFGIQAISTIGFFLLTLLLGTADVGLFAIVAESVGILGYFSDVGLASALIQQKKEVTKDELRTTFFIQQVLVAAALILVAILYFNIAHSKGYGSKETWILIALCFSFFAASLKTIPSVLLERQLNFKLISTIDITENITFYLFAVLFAFMGFGAYSYAIATFIRSVAGLILMYRFSSWPIGFSFSQPAAARLFKYGIPFQLNSFIAMAKDRLSNLIVAGILGRESFGLLSWAQKGPRIPLSFMDAIMRVTFPTFARLQDHPDYLKNSLKRSLYFIALFIFPALTGLALVAPEIIKIIPKYSKWLPAVVPLYFYAASYAIAAVTTPITNAFNAVGKITVTTRLMVMWTVLTWLFFPYFSFRFGYLGTAWATLIVGSSSVVVWFLAKKTFDVDVISTIRHPLTASLLMLVVLIFLSALNLSPSFSLALKISLGAIVYLGYHLLFSRPQISWFITQIKPLAHAQSIS